jgi:enoyl-[acyl-carrier-protein] reductase (NADH)
MTFVAHAFASSYAQDRGIAGFNKILKAVSDTAPMRRNVTIEEVGNVAAFLRFCRVAR